MSVIKATEPQAIETIKPNPTRRRAPHGTHVLGEHDPEPFVPLFGPEAVQAPDQEPASVNAQSAADPTDEPSVELVREGDEVRAIVVRCRCGERIRLDCEF